jgi:hypothetical protein
MPLYRHTKLPPPPELADKPFWRYLPRGSTRRVFFLLIALGAVLVIKHAGGWSFGGLLEAPRTGARGGGGGADPASPVYHIKITPPGDVPVPKNPSAP